MNTFPSSWHRPHLDASIDESSWTWSKMAYVYHRGKWYFSKAIIMAPSYDSPHCRAHIDFGGDYFLGYAYAWTKSPCEATEVRKLIDYMTKHRDTEIQTWLDNLPDSAHQRHIVTPAGEQVVAAVKM